MIAANILNIPSGSPSPEKCSEKWLDFTPLKSWCVIEPTDEGTRAYISWNHVTKDEHLLYQLEFKSVPEMPNGSMIRKFPYKGYRSPQYWEPGYEEHEDRKGTKKDRRPYVQLRNNYTYTVVVTCALLDSPNTIISKDTIRLTGPCNRNGKVIPAGEIKPPPKLKNLPSTLICKPPVVPERQAPQAPQAPVRTIEVEYQVYASSIEMNWTLTNKDVKYRAYYTRNKNRVELPQPLCYEERCRAVLEETEPGKEYEVSIEGKINDELVEFNILKLNTGKKSLNMADLNLDECDHLMGIWRICYKCETTILETYMGVIYDCNCLFHYSGCVLRVREEVLWNSSNNC